MGRTQAITHILVWAESLEFEYEEDNVQILVKKVCLGYTVSNLVTNLGLQGTMAYIMGI